MPDGNLRYLQSNGQIPKSNKQKKLHDNAQNTDCHCSTQMYLCKRLRYLHKNRALTEKEKQALLLQLSIAKFILLKDTENPLEIQSYIPARKAVEISLLDILEATGEHLNCNRPITEQFYAQYGRAAQKLGIINQIARIYLKEITLTDL